MRQHGGVAEPSEVLAARKLYEQRAWEPAFAALSRVEAAEGLRGKDRERLGRAAYMLGLDDEYVAALERAVDAHVEAGAAAPAAQCAFWFGLNLMPRGESALARGGFARAERILERDGVDCVERGYLLIPALLGCVGSGDVEGAYSIACDAVAIAERFDDPDLSALARMEQGHALVRLGHSDKGYGLVDETLVALSTRQLSPVVTGIVYCNTILFCTAAFEFARAKEWTTALTRWCGEQPDMVAHTGLCMVHRAELMDLEGAWEQARAEAERAATRTGGVLNRGAAGHAFYRQAEILRRQGSLAAAEAAYEEAAAYGREPQPGLALLRVAQGNTDAALAAIRRVEAETEGGLERARVLPALVEIALGAGDIDVARRACDELETIAAGQGSGVLDAYSAQARGTVALADGIPRDALIALRRGMERVARLRRALRVGSNPRARRTRLPSAR